MKMSAHYPSQLEARRNCNMNDKPAFFYTHPGDKAKAIAFGAQSESMYTRMRLLGALCGRSESLPTTGAKTRGGHTSKYFCVRIFPEQAEEEVYGVSTVP